MDVRVENRKIEIVQGELIGDNQDYNITFTFDSEWDGIVKTARFIKDGFHKDVIIENNHCLIPIEVLKFGYVRIGVYSSTMTTTYDEFFVKESILQNNVPQIAPAPVNADNFIVINTITIEEDIAEIDISQDAEGNQIDLKSMMLVITIPVVESRRQVYVDTYCDTVNLFSVTTYGASGYARISKIGIEQFHGVWFPYGTNPGNVSENSITQMGTTHKIPITVEDCPAITHVTFTGQTVIPIGTTIIIYGIKR